MTDAKKYIWVIPVIAGFFAIVSLLTPAASLNYMGMISADLWMWDLYTWNYTMVSSGAEFVGEPLVLIPSIISTSLFVIGGILLLVAAIRLRVRNLEQVNITIPSVLSGVAIIIAEIMWLSMVPTNFPTSRFFSGYPGTFWKFYAMSFHTVGFGIIGGFISAAIAFGGAGVAYYYSKERKVTSPKKKEVTPPIKASPVSETPERISCPECGVEIKDLTMKFCGNCGSALKPPEIAPL
ncbi:MAG: zinc ribbon domain-containing protein [Promethearchaeota archaeon]